ncbi:MULTISPECIES: YezD family protein [unclassified Sphingobium]|uniref:YezD family protein n=1 Tax=unclassified Sphingobium TaxID=2611147 RepID=UPI0035A6C46B
MNEQGHSAFHHARADAQRPDILASIDKVRGVLEGLRFGSITLTVHDARVVQIDVTEKTRLTAGQA